ncbi:MAG: sodium:proton antiporter [Phycisphaerales bacterium]|jgi:Na+/H+ antiporter NhaD/arsenite permease-like protein|nr:sodium:proton antiporter [Phycisphaerales bacterium]
MSTDLTRHEEHGPAGARVWTWSICIAGTLAVLTALVWGLLTGHGHHEAHAPHAPAAWGLGVAPFAVLLGAIAVLPLIPATEGWWHSNLSRFFVAILCGLATLVYIWIVEGWAAVGTTLDHAILQEYVPFIMLLFSLYVISGGIHIGGDVRAHPAVNTGWLALGAAIASFIGTTGASMLLIRPLLNTNRERKHVVHTVVMFIFLVSNIGGTLLPIGDPPLFLGYLEGVPFFWTFGLWVEWAFACCVLLAVYFVWDSVMYAREAPAVKIFDRVNVQPLRLEGSVNILWLLGIVACVAFITPGKPVPGTEFVAFDFLRELIMLALVALSLLTTQKHTREANRFDYGAIIEVAALFIGIFIAMQVPLHVLKAQGEGIAEALSEPWMYFWITGGLSSVLDNAPTYLVFFQLAKSGTVEGDPAALELLGGGAIVELPLIAISLGAVFMGSMTYIGNGPNFMVKAIAEQSGVRMPSFFGYVIRYSIPVLVPVFILATLLMTWLHG